MVRLTIYLSKLWKKNLRYTISAKKASYQGSKERPAFPVILYVHVQKTFKSTFISPYWYMGLPKVQSVKHTEQKAQINLTERIASKKSALGWMYFNHSQTLRKSVLDYKHSHPHISLCFFPKSTLLQYKEFSSESHIQFPEHVNCTFIYLSSNIILNYPTWFLIHIYINNG